MEFLKATMMGPNAMRVSEELASHLSINKNMRILDLGCGCGLSTLLLTKKYGVSVLAADLWISPTENYERFQSIGIDDKAVPISVDATKGLPFANGYFDLLFSVDAYHYFGDTAEMLPSLIPFVKKGGYIAVAVPGLKFEFGENVPEEMQPFWIDEVDRTIHSLDWWKQLWSRAHISSISAGEPVQVGLHLNFYCIEAVRRQCLCAAIQQGAAHFPARLHFSFVPVSQPQLVA